ncbi:uncharacterized protein [Nicotiana sylvestris]|uniref:uncharacterized protein n=1 Tax=Nicotiana sylvestris TaxID=4096 RepID=UPI00388C39B0
MTASFVWHDCKVTGVVPPVHFPKSGNDMSFSSLHQCFHRVSSKLSFKFPSPSSCFTVVMSAMPKFVHQEEESSASISCSVGGTPPASGSIKKFSFPSLQKSRGCHMRSLIWWIGLGNWQLAQLSMSVSGNICPKIRLCPLGEEEGSSASRPRNDNQLKESSNDEDAHSEASLARRLKEDVSAELVAPEASSLGRVSPPLSLSSLPVKGTSRDTGVLSSSSFPVEGTSKDIGVLISSLPPVESTSKDIRGQGPPKSSGVSSDHVPTKVGSTRAGETRTVDACSTFEEAQRLCSVAFDKLKSKLLRCQARLRKALDGKKTLRFLCDKRAKYECNELRDQIDALVASKKNALAKASALKVQLQNARENSLVQMSGIASLESDLVKTKAEVVDVWADAEAIRAKADKKVAIYLKDVADAQAKLRGASDRESRSNEYARCKSWRETLEEIHARGFDLSKEIEQTRSDEHDTKFLVCDSEYNEESGRLSRSPRGESRIGF